MASGRGMEKDSVLFKEFDLEVRLSVFKFYIGGSWHKTVRIDMERLRSVIGMHCTIFSPKLIKISCWG